MAQYRVPLDVSGVKLKPVFNSGTYSNPVETSITTFKWLLVENNVGDYTGNLSGDNTPTSCNANSLFYDPKNCEWPSIHSIKAMAPIYSSGNNTEWNEAQVLVGLTTGKYMVTVMAESYRLCGGYFEVIANQETLAQTVKVICQPHPLPLGTIHLFVFEDNMPCNGQYDPGKKGLSDFGIGVNDIEGEHEFCFV